MHELSIAQNLLALCQTQAKKANATRVSQIHVKLGRLSGVEAHYLQSAFEVIQAGTICEQAKLIIDIQNIVIKCNQCGETSELDLNEFVCPNCRSYDINVIDGEDMMLMRVVLD